MAKVYLVWRIEGAREDTNEVYRVFTLWDNAATYCELMNSRRDSEDTHLFKIEEKVLY